jgi:TonB family protein
MKGNTVLLVIIAILLSAILYLSYTNFQQIQVLRQENTNLWEKIDSVQQICSKKPVKQSSAHVAKPATTGSVFLDYLIQLGEEERREKERTRAKEKINVTSKYRLEDRYVLSEVREPELKGSEVGEVVLNILVDYSGDVKSAKLQSATGITDEEVIEACKKAALKTSFNYNSDHRDDKAGTITYTFSSK